MHLLIAAHAIIDTPAEQGCQIGFVVQESCA